MLKKPTSLLAQSKFSAQFCTTDTVFGGCQIVDNVKCFQNRQFAFMKQRAGCWRFAMIATGTLAIVGFVSDTEFTITTFNTLKTF
jgi:hypothetical protein